MYHLYYKNVAFQTVQENIFDLKLNFIMCVYVDTCKRLYVRRYIDICKWICLDVEGTGQPKVPFLINSLFYYFQTGLNIWLV